MPLTEKQIATEVMAIFKIIVICIIITAIGCLYLYLNPYIPPTQYGPDEIDMDARREIYQRISVRRNWWSILKWSLIVLIGGRYLVKIYRWAKTKSA